MEYVLFVDYNGKAVLNERFMTKVAAIRYMNMLKNGMETLGKSLVGFTFEIVEIIA